MFQFKEQNKGQFWLRFQAPFSMEEEAAYLASLRTLSDMKKNFVVIVVFGDHTPLSAEGRKQQNLWFKENRGHLGEFCKGIVRVSAHYEKVGLDKSNFSKAMPFSIMNVRTEEEAEVCLFKYDETGELV